MDKRCLIIDNEDQIDSIDTIKRLGKPKGMNITCDQFNIGMISRDDLLTDNKIDLTKVFEVYNRDYHKNAYHLVAIDWDLGEIDINGVELIRRFRESRILLNSPKILYSGLLKDELSSILSRFENKEINKNTVINWMNTLIKVNVENFVDRVSYEQEIITQLSKATETLDIIIEEELKTFPTLKFKNSFVSQNFNGKSFEEIATILEQDNGLKNEFKREIIKQVIAYLTEKI